MFDVLGDIVNKLGPLAGLFRGKTPHLPFDKAHAVAIQYAQTIYNILANLYGVSSVGSGGVISSALRVRLLSLLPGMRFAWETSPQYRDLSQRNNLNVYQILDLYYTYQLQQFDVNRSEGMQEIMVADLDIVRGAIIDAGFDDSEFINGLEIVRNATGITVSSPKATFNRATDVVKYGLVVAAIIFGGTLIYKGVTK